MHMHGLSDHDILLKLFAIKACWINVCWAAIDRLDVQGPQGGIPGQLFLLFNCILCQHNIASLLNVLCRHGVTLDLVRLSKALNRIAIE